MLEQYSSRSKLAIDFGGTHDTEHILRHNVYLDRHRLHLAKYAHHHRSRSL